MHKNTSESRTKNSSDNTGVSFQDGLISTYLCLKKSREVKVKPRFHFMKNLNKHWHREPWIWVLYPHWIWKLHKFHFTSFRLRCSALKDRWAYPSVKGLGERWFPNLPWQSTPEFNNAHPFLGSNQNCTHCIFQPLATYSVIGVTRKTSHLFLKITSSWV